MAKKKVKVGDMYQGMIITKIGKNTLYGVTQMGKRRKIKWVKDRWLL
jgi:hypothetical protein